MTIHNTPPCPMCGVWKCLECGVLASRRSRYFPGKHACRKCKSVNGKMLPTHHRPAAYEDHAAQFDPRESPRYPLEEHPLTTTKAS